MKSPETKSAPEGPRVRTYEGIRLSTGVAVVAHHTCGERRGVCVMAYIGGRGKRGARRNQITKRFNPPNYSSMEACIADAVMWRRMIEESWG